MKTDGKYLLEPVPHDEAIAFIKDKPVVSRDVFDHFLPDLKARAFTITGVESANVRQKVRDRIADLPAGANWDDVKKDIVADLSPWLVDESADPEVRDAQIAAANRRAELLIRTHGFQAYQATQYDVMTRQKEVFPFWQYMSMQDEAVRESHAALDGLILPADSPFWKDHYPPWDWGCRCQVVSLTEEEAAAAGADPEAYGRMLSDVEERRLENQGVLDDGAGHNIDVTSPSASGKEGAFQWNPGDLRIPLDQLKDRFDSEVWDSFQKWAEKETLDASGTTVMDWLKGKKVAGQINAGTTAEKIDNMPLAEIKKTFQQSFGCELHTTAPQPRIWGAKLSKEKASDHAKKLLGSYRDLTDRFPSMPKTLKGIVLTDSHRGRANLAGPMPQLSTKAKEWDDATWQKVEAWEMRNGRKWGTERRGTQIDDNFRHEMGHVLSDPATVKAWKDEIEPTFSKQWFQEHVSEYAGKKTKEAIAESFGLFTRKDYVMGMLPKEIERVLKTMTGGA
jgi:SPP1 gp7 family putative phage head morphogenesis protein